MIENIELLAPVGSMEALYAAVENGADAVYLGGKLFNARQYALNFDDEQLKEAVQYAHIRNVKVYVTLNIVMSDKELEEVIDYLIYLYNIDVDAVIIQDLGLARLIRGILPDLEIHGSTQMTINNYMGVKFLEELGFQRVVLARELSLSDINYIRKNTKMELEGFIHGALCVSYSGQCLMSSILGGRSGNRGRCAQPCRMPYSIVDIESGNIVKQEIQNRYLLSPKDLNTIEYLKEIIDSGITSLKIEGRMKRPEYVAITVSNYRKAIEKLKENNNETVVNEIDKKEIAQIFNRGFTKGYLFNEFGRKLISFDRPNNRGIYLGRVTEVDNKFIYIKLEDFLSEGDGIEIINRDRENVGIIVDKIYSLDNRNIKYGNKGETVKLRAKKGIKSESIIYKTSDIKLLNKAKESYVNDKNKMKIGINMSLDIQIGQPIALYLWDNSGNYVSVKSDELVERGLNVALTKEKVKRQMSKLGGTPYYIESIEINMVEGSMISFSILNNVRRKAIDELNKKRGILNNRIEVDREKILRKGKELLQYNKSNKNKQKLISVKVSNLNQFNKLDLNKLDRIYLNFTDNLRECIDIITKAQKEVYISTERIIDNEEFRKLASMFDNIDMSKVNGISVSNVGTLKFIKDRYDTNIHCDMGLNIFNSSAVKLLQEYGVSSVTLSPELKLSQISEITGNSEIICETVGYGYLPLMISKYCPMSLIKECVKDEDCSECRLQTGYGLLDRKGMIFPMVRRKQTTIIYNSQPMMILEHLPKIYNSGVEIIRLDFTIENDELNDILEIYYLYANGSITEEEVNKFVGLYRKKTSITKGHYFRGVI
jgi:putative protease